MTARSLPLPSGVGHGPDDAAGVDEMEGDADSDVVPHGVIDRSAEGRNARNERKKSLARICCNGETNRLLKMTWAS